MGFFASSLGLSGLVDPQEQTTNDADKSRVKLDFMSAVWRRFV